MQSSLLAVLAVVAACGTSSGPTENPSATIRPENCDCHSGCGCPDTGNQCTYYACVYHTWSGWRCELNNVSATLCTACSDLAAHQNCVVLGTCDGLGKCQGSVSGCSSGNGGANPVNYYSCMPENGCSGLNACPCNYDQVNNTYACCGGNTSCGSTCTATNPAPCSEGDNADATCRIHHHTQPTPNCP
jgi:hypothetical protein